MEFENPFPALPVFNQFDPSACGQEFRWFLDKNQKIVALPYEFVKQNSTSTNQKLKEYEDPSIPKPTSLILTIHTEDGYDANETNVYDDDMPFIGDPIINTIEQPLQGECDLGEYPCVKSSWYLELPKLSESIADEDCVVDTKTLAKDFKAFLKRQGIPLQQFAVNIIKRTQGTLSDLVNHPRSWSMLTEKGRSEYVVMISFLAASNLQELIAALKQKHSKTVLASSPKPRVLPASFINTVEAGILPSDSDIEHVAISLSVGLEVLVQYCKDQCIIARLQSNNEEINFNDQLTYFDDASGSYICPFFKCGSILANKASLRVHCRSHKFSCDQCKESFMQVEELDHHKAIYHPTKQLINNPTGDIELGLRLQCGVCPASFRSRGKMAHHVTSVHQATKLTRGMTCHICFNDYKTVSLLSSHMRSHTNQRPFKCEQCDKTFHTKGNLQRHVRTHSDDKPHKCKICGQGFTELKSVKIHMGIHKNYRPFICMVCSKGFTQKAALNRHIEAVHNGTVKHICELCGAKFSQRYNLTIHLDAHKGVKRFKCDECGHLFSKKNDLKRHAFTHSGEQPYRCSLCAQGFTRSEYLKKHIARDHPTNIFECVVCKKSFNDDVTAYQQHIRTHEAEHQVIIQAEPRFTTYRSTSQDIEIQCVNGLQINSDTSSTVFMSTGQIFNGQKQFLITTVPTMNEVNMSGGLEATGGDTSMIYEASTSSDQHSLILQAVGMPGNLTTDDNSTDALLFAEIGSSDHVLHAPIVGMPLDNGVSQSREGMVESSDPNMHSVIVESSSDHDVMMTHSDITRAVTMTMRNML